MSQYVHTMYYHQLLRYLYINKYMGGNLEDLSQCPHRRKFPTFFISCLFTFVFSLLKLVFELHFILKSAIFYILFTVSCLFTFGLQSAVCLHFVYNQLQIMMKLWPLHFNIEMVSMNWDEIFI